MKAFWVAVWAGVAISIAGLAVMTIGRNYNLGVLMLVGGLVVSVLGVVMRIVTAWLDAKGVKPS